MRHLTRVSIIMAGSAALIGSMILPASAADVKEGTNDATVEIEAGFLVLDTTEAEFTLVHTGASTGVSKAEGTLTGVNVSDLNSDGLGWTSTAVLTDLANGLEKIDASAATYTSDELTQSGTGVTALDNTVTADTVENNTASWNTTVVVNVPNTTKAGTYTGTLTHSLV